MDHLWIPTVAGLLVMLASLASVELGISVALIEISLGVVAGNVLGLQSPPWMDFLASFGSIVLTFLAGAEVDPEVMRAKLRESLLIGGLSFAAPFFGTWLVCGWGLGWSLPAAQIAGVALSTTSLAVVYAVLVETGWDKHWRTDAYFEGHPFLTEDAANYLAQSGAKLVGIDSYNIDDTADGRRPVHTILLGREIPIVEHMTGLDQLPPEGFEFYAIPPKVRAFGTFPVRAFAKMVS